MDHVESAPDSPYSPLEVPCLSKELYEHHDFLTYPEHEGWEITRLLDGNFTERENAAAFLQNWLFFGVLWEHHYLKEQQGHPHEIITVTGLEEQILELTSFIPFLRQSGDNTTAEHIGSCIERFLRTGDPRPGFITWPLPVEIDLSISTFGPGLSWSFATAGLCPSEVALVEETFSSASAYYTSQLESPPSATEKDYSRCTRSLCMARQLNEGAYRTAHASADCDCQHYGPLMDEVTSVIKSGGVPLLFEVKKYTEGKRYFPGSDRLILSTGWRSESSGQRNSTGHSSYFGWTRSNKSMKPVYERAFRVLVLGGDIQSFSSSDYTQSFMRIRLSAWMRRLWTLNEGILANELCIKFNDGIFDVHERPKTQQSEAYDSELAQTKHSYGTPMRDADNFHWKLRLLRVNVISELDPRMVRRTTYSSRETSPEAKRSLYRSTSKERDEMLCFATLRWDTFLLKGLPFEDHMHAFLSTETHLPQGMLFLAGPRMQQRGWRWATNRFGNCGAKRLNVKSDDMTMGLVEYPALVLPLVSTLAQLQSLVVSVDIGNGSVGRFQIMRHHEDLGHGEDKSESGEERRRQLYVLYWDMTKTMPIMIPMSAAVISGPLGEGVAKGEVVYRFECLAYVEILGRANGTLEENGHGVAQLVLRQ
ncbi:hypothetical protein BDV10DRAFT_203586 [Aspergillus recurvatus]